MATLTGKAGIIYDCQMMTEPRPSFYRALEKHDCPLAPIQPSRWCGVFHRPSFYSKPQRQSLAEAVTANSLWSPISLSFPTGCHTSSLTQGLSGSLGQPLGNEVCLWGNLMDSVVCWVGRCFVIADGHLVSAKLQGNWEARSAGHFPEDTLELSLLGSISRSHHLISSPLWHFEFEKAAKIITDHSPIT